MPVAPVHRAGALGAELVWPVDQQALRRRAGRSGAAGGRGRTRVDVVALPRLAGVERGVPGPPGGRCVHHRLAGGGQLLGQQPPRCRRCPRPLTAGRANARPRPAACSLVVAGGCTQPVDDPLVAIHGVGRARASVRVDPDPESWASPTSPMRHTRRGSGVSPTWRPTALCPVMPRRTPAGLADRIRVSPAGATGDIRATRPASSARCRSCRLHPCPCPPAADGRSAPAVRWTASQAGGRAKADSPQAWRTVTGTQRAPKMPRG